MNEPKWNKKKEGKNVRKRNSQQLKGEKIFLFLSISMSVTSVCIAQKFTDINECCDLEKSIKTLQMT